MRHGWKTRIDERKYFEEKKEQREQEIIIRRFANSQMEMEIKQKLDLMRRGHEIN